MNKIYGLKNFGRTTSHQREALPSPIETGQHLSRLERPRRQGHAGKICARVLPKGVDLAGQAAAAFF